MDKKEKIFIKEKMEDMKFDIQRKGMNITKLLNMVDIKTLSEILGHSNVKITLDRYVHIKFEEKVIQINMMSIYRT